MAPETSKVPKLGPFFSKQGKFFSRNRIDKKLLDFLDEGSLYFMQKSVLLYLRWLQILRGLNIAYFSRVINFEEVFQPFFEIQSTKSSLIL